MIEEIRQRDEMKTVEIVDRKGGKRKKGEGKGMKGRR